MKVELKNRKKKNKLKWKRNSKDKQKKKIDHLHAQDKRTDLKSKYVLKKQNLKKFLKKNQDPQVILMRVHQNFSKKKMKKQ
jgi:hypothetical protein